MLVEAEDSPRFLVAADEPRLLVENEAFIRKLIALPTPLDLVPDESGPALIFSIPGNSQYIGQVV